MIIKKVSDLENILESLRLEKKKKIYFIPTMGSLHKGHISLIKFAEKKKAFIILSIFVNPLQFDDKKDFKKYPRDLQKDIRIIKDLKINVVLLPEISFAKDLSFPNIKIKKLDKKLCGIDRPGHFLGVASVVLKFLNLIRPNFIVLGEKDFQQILVIKKIIKDFSLKTKVIGLPIIREKSGLALSSRNKLIPPEKIKIAENIYTCLKQISKGIITNGLEIKELKSYQNKLLKLGIERVNYLEILKETNLEVLDQKPSIARIFISVKFFGIKLIDNLRVSKRLVQKKGFILGVKD
ncbi:MAG: pantoate--beta-alanine ligase [Alphaproteobacteria bacterium]